LQHAANHAPAFRNSAKHPARCAKASRITALSRKLSASYRSSCRAELQRTVRIKYGISTRLPLVSCAPCTNTRNPKLIVKFNLTATSLYQSVIKAKDTSLRMDLLLVYYIRSSGEDRVHSDGNDNPDTDKLKIISHAWPRTSVPNRDVSNGRCAISSLPSHAIIPQRDTLLIRIWQVYARYASGIALQAN
jgi:hypothetical protein